VFVGVACAGAFLKKERDSRDTSGGCLLHMTPLLAACAFFAHVLHCKQDVFH
jgi:hypothetical protein